MVPVARESKISLPSSLADGMVCSRVQRITQAGWPSSKRKRRRNRRRSVTRRTRRLGGDEAGLTEPRVEAAEKTPQKEAGQEQWDQEQEGETESEKNPEDEGADEKPASHTDDAAIED